MGSACLRNRWLWPVGEGGEVALVALTQAGIILAWDPTNRALIVTNIVGTMPWTQHQ
ncbi:MAG TPA: hypothetical protein VE441_03100 [Mycobacterium sp.]|jgi:hypothetical protein|nr:hypothetical protein [Mycobacterium sp.]